MDWQNRYETGDTPWDKGGPHPALLDYTRENGTFTGRILVPGSGFGYDVRAIATHENHVIGLDVAAGAIDAAKSSPPSASEEYILGDLFNLDAPLRTSFDWVIEHTCFCAIDPAMRESYVSAVSGALRPGGRMFAIFYLDPGDDREPPPYGVATHELDSLFGPCFAIEKEWVPERTYAGREGKELIRMLALR